MGVGSRGDSRWDLLQNGWQDSRLWEISGRCRPSICPYPSSRELRVRLGEGESVIEVIDYSPLFFLNRRGWGGWVVGRDLTWLLVGRSGVISKLSHAFVDNVITRMSGR